MPDIYRSKPLEVRHELPLSQEVYVGELTDESGALIKAEGPRHRAMTIESARQLGQLLYEREMRTRILTDPLTDLRNLNGLQEDLPKFREHANHTGQTYTVCVLDLNDVKSVNDTAGHNVGDMYIAAGGKALKKSLHPGDAAYRIGGDEFIAVLMNDRSTDPDPDVLKTTLVERLEVNLANEVLNCDALTAAGELYGLVFGSGLGVQTWNPGSMEFDYAKNEADKAMYINKWSGKRLRAAE